MFDPTKDEHGDIIWNKVFLGSLLLALIGIGVTLWVTQDTTIGNVGSVINVIMGAP